MSDPTELVPDAPSVYVVLDEYTDAHDVHVFQSRSDFISYLTSTYKEKFDSTARNQIMELEVGESTLFNTDATGEKAILVWRAPFTAARSTGGRKRTYRRRR